MLGLPDIRKQRQHGFTLLEVMLVFVLIGIFVSAVRFTMIAEEPEDRLEQASARFAGIFNIAAEYGLLNNIELGLVVEDNTYQLVGFDGIDWKEIPEQEIFTLQELPDGISIELTLEDLPIQEDAFFENDGFFSDEDAFEEDDIEEQKKLKPKVFLLSGGDLTPFVLSFSLDDEFELGLDVRYDVVGLYTLPLKIIGPLYDDEALEAEMLIDEEVNEDR